MAYRDDLEALRIRVNSLEGELEGLRESACRIEGLENDLAAARRELEKQEARRALPLLDNVRVASPCNVSWDDMVGDERTRFCGKCEKNVFNVAAMTRDEAEALLRAANEELCMRLYRRLDGTVITADCPVGSRRKRRRNALVAVALGSGLAAAGLYAADTATMGELERGATAVPDHDDPTIAVEEPDEVPAIMGTVVPVVPSAPKK